MAARTKLECTMSTPSEGAHDSWGHWQERCDHVHSRWLFQTMIRQWQKERGSPKRGSLELHRLNLGKLRKMVQLRSDDVFCSRYPWSWTIPTRSFGAVRAVEIVHWPYRTIVGAAFTLASASSWKVDYRNRAVPLFFAEPQRRAVVETGAFGRWTAPPAAFQA